MFKSWCDTRYKCSFRVAFAAKIHDKTCDTICIHLAHGIFLRIAIFLKTMKSHCAFRIMNVDNLGKIWNCWEWNGFQSWFEILMKSKTNRLVENNEIWIELRRPSDVLDNAEPAFHPFSSPLAQHKYDYALLYLNNYQIQHLLIYWTNKH